MANQRIFLWAALALVLWFNYDAWQRDYAPKPAPEVARSEAPGETPATAPPPSTLNDVPAPPSSDAAPSPAPAQTAPAVAPDIESGNDIRVLTDVIDLRIALLGGEIGRAHV